MCFCTKLMTISNVCLFCDRIQSKNDLSGEVTSPAQFLAWSVREIPFKPRLNLFWTTKCPLCLCSLDPLVRILFCALSQIGPNGGKERDRRVGTSMCVLACLHRCFKFAFQKTAFQWHEDWRNGANNLSSFDHNSQWPKFSTIRREYGR